jgi:hypothetical protein
MKVENIKDQSVHGSLNKKGRRRCHLLLNKRCPLLPPFWSNEPGPGNLPEVKMFLNSATKRCKMKAAEYKYKKNP